MQKLARIVIAAVSSGAGKTTIVSGILAGMKAMQKIVQSYKIGPDYIDPGYHQLASGRSAHNLDTWLVDVETARNIFCRTAKTADIAVIEGVMGLYDGGKNGISSTAEIAKKLQAPVVLVIDVKSMGASAAAIALGFKSFDPDLKLAGVILNRVGSKSHEAMIREALAPLRIPVLGAVYRDAELALPERHLGLTPVGEMEAEAVMEAIKTAIAEQVDLAALWEIAQTAPPLTDIAPIEHISDPERVRIGVARDEAFNFYYPESLQVLESHGAEIIPFSPLKDRKLPEVDGILIGGGFPEMFVKELAVNFMMMEDIFAAGKSGMPIFAECGGLMYLMKQIEDFAKQTYGMVGLIPAVCQMNTNMQTVGYVEATALRDTVLGPAGIKIRGHEFHFSTMTATVDSSEEFPWAFEFTKMRTEQMYIAGYASENILASYLHLHFAGNVPLAKFFLKKCAEFRQGVKTCE